MRCVVCETVSRCVVNVSLTKRRFAFQDYLNPKTYTLNQCGVPKGHVHDRQVQRTFNTYQKAVRGLGCLPALLVSVQGLFE